MGQTTTTASPAAPTELSRVLPRQPNPPPFLVTKEHRKFVEFADACRRDRYIGVCYGPPGVGKTLSARVYSHADSLQPYLDTRFRYRRGQQPPPPPPDLDSTRTAMWTPAVTITPRQLTSQVASALTLLSTAIEDLHRPADEPASWAPGAPFTELLIVDEADRLKTPGLEHLRDVYDRHDLGLVLIGMPGLERRLARYPQLYSRIGFAHTYRPLTPAELTWVLTHHWQRLGLTLTADDFTDAEAVAAVARITGGNFRLVHRLFAQIERILQINDLTHITREVVETARQNLVIGT